VHEYSIASEIWESVKKASGQQGSGRVLSIALEVGALNLIPEDQLTFWLETLAERDGSPGMQVQITTLPPRLRCRECGAETIPEGAGATAEACPEGRLYEPTVSACSACGSRDVTIEGGREIRVVSAEVIAGSA